VIFGMPFAILSNNSQKSKKLKTVEAVNKITAINL
jgi:hypothetical protein